MGGMFSENKLTAFEKKKVTVEAGRFLISLLKSNFLYMFKKYASLY